MRKVYTHENRLLVFHYKNLLDEQDIECFIKNEFSSGGVGELSPFETWPELWVVNDEDVEQAEKLCHPVASAKAGARHCPHCGEINESNFHLCWHCGKALDD